MFVGRTLLSTVSLVWSQSCRTSAHVIVGESFFREEKKSDRCVRTRWAPITLDCLATAQVARNTHQKEAVGIFRKKGVGGKFELSWMLLSKKNPSHVSWIKSERLWLKRHMIGLFDIILVEENIELLISSYTLPKTNLSPENRGSQKESCIPTTNCQVLC